ncbi:MAG: trigger factor [Spirochaetota bacterium]
MVSEKQIEHIDNSAVRLTVTVAKDTLRGEYDKLLKEYAKKAQIKGFRKGKVPPEILERKFGDSIKAEAGEKVLQDSLREAIEEIDEQPLPYAQPELDSELDFELDKDFTYSVTYDVFPEIELGEYKGLEIEAPEVEITEEDEQRELSAIQEQNAIVIDKEEGAVEQDDIVTIDYAEVDENDETIEGTSREDFVFTIGTGYNYFKIDDDLIGMKQGEEKILEKEYPEDSDVEELRGEKKRLRVKVKAIKQRELPEIDDELAQDVSDEYETLDDLKKDIRRRLEQTAESRVREMKKQAILDKVLENSKIEVPASMLQAELENSWRNFTSRLQMNEEDVVNLLSAQGRSKEDLLEEWKPEAEKSLKQRLLTNKMLENENVEVGDEEIDQHLEEQARQSNVDTARVREYYESNNMLDYVKHDIQERKLLDQILEETTVTTSEKLNFLDVAGQHA